MGRLRIGFLMDPLSGIKAGHDTTFALMLEAQRRGHEVLAFEQADVFFAKDRSLARMKSLRLSPGPAEPFTVVAEEPRPIAALDVLFLRKDPPVDDEYLHATQLVELCGGVPPAFLNRPSGLRSANEKLFALRFPELCPRTVIDRDPARLRAFFDEVGDGIIKGLDGFAGLEVVRVSRGDPNAAALIELMTERGTRHVVAQQYLGAASHGDKRILLLDGEPLGAVLRVAQGEDFRNNLAAGARAVKSEVDARDREICARLAPDLRAEGLHFVGIDVIGGWLTEVNVTSPTGIVEAEAFTGSDLCSRVLAHAEQLAAARLVGSGPRRE